MSRPTQVYSREFDARLADLPPETQRRIEKAITEMGLRFHDFPHHRLTGSDNFRLRVGDYRIIYQIDLQIGAIYLITLGHRSDIYRR